MKIVRFNGRVSAGGSLDMLVTSPIASVWSAGDEIEFTPAFCQSHNRQCRPPCEEGDLCDCWAETFASLWNRGHENQDPPPFEVIERDDAPFELPEAHDAPPPAADATPDEDAGNTAEDQ